MAVSYKKLWKLLIDKDMNKSDLQKASGVSWATITKLSKGENVGVGVLAKVCATLNCDLGDIAEMVPEDNEGAVEK
jgi:DNA-binding Xre family transcriptional regulator